MQLQPVSWPVCLRDITRQTLVRWRPKGGPQLNVG